MLSRIKPIIIVLFFIALFTPVAGQQSEEEMDDMFLNDDSSSSDSVSDSRLEVYGYLENENIYAPVLKQVAKLEARNRTTIHAGSPFFFAHATADAFFYPGFEGVTDPATSGSISLYELYLAMGEKVQFRVGQMVYNWGVADAFRVVNYLDKRDLSELFFKEEDERYGGTFGAAFKVLFGDFMVEAIFVPVLNPFAFPDSDSYWGLQPATVSGQVSQYDLTNLPDNRPENFSYALRGGGTFGPVDVHLSYFHGVSNSVMFRPELKYDLTGNLQSVTASPLYHVSDKVGLDVAFTTGKLAARGEVVYSPNHVALVKKKFVQKSVSGTTLIMEQKTAESGYFSFSTGVDYNLWGNYGTVLIEYTKSFLITTSNLENEFFSGFLMVALKDKWFNEKLEVNGAFLIRPVDEDSGYIPSVSFTWEFQDGLKLTAGYMAFIGNKDELISMYDEKDIFYLRARINY
ncbi:MAG: hypothetical protein ABUK01_14865 [Leptospirales bacterium]